MEYEGSYSCIRESLIYFSYIRLIAWWCDTARQLAADTPLAAEEPEQELSDVAT